MRKGDIVHDLIRHQIHEKIMTEKHGPSWRDVLKEQREEERKREIERKWIQLEEKKKNYWPCPNGLEFCHNQLTKKADRERQGDYTPPWDLRTCSDCTLKLEEANKRTYYRCIRAYPWCHKKSFSRRSSCVRHDWEAYAAAKSADLFMNSTQANL